MPVGKKDTSTVKMPLKYLHPEVHS